MIYYLVVPKVGGKSLSGMAKEKFENHCFNIYYGAVVPKPWAVDQHRFVGQLVLGRTKIMHNLHYFIYYLLLLHFIYYLMMNDVLF